MNLDHALIREIDTIFRETYRDETQNAQRNHAKWAKNLPMDSYMVNNPLHGVGNVHPITFTQENVTSLHYPLCNAVMVKVMLVRKGMKDILVDNGSSINILFGAASDKLLVDHELTP